MGNKKIQRKIPKKVQKKYIKNRKDFNGNPKCPHCKSTKINTDPNVDIDPIGAAGLCMIWECADCKRAWSEEFELKRLEFIDC